MSKISTAGTAVTPTDVKVRAHIEHLQSVHGYTFSDQGGGGANTRGNVDSHFCTEYILHRRVLHVIYQADGILPAVFEPT